MKVLMLMQQLQKNIDAVDTHPVEFASDLKFNGENPVVFSAAVTNFKMEVEPIPTSFPGFYMIVNAMSNLALDGNTGGARQRDPRHPRPFMWAPTPSARNHHWSIQHVGDDFFVLSLRGTNALIDGNTQPHIPQTDPRNPAPFLHRGAQADNHRWQLVRGRNGRSGYGQDSFVLINKYTHLALDGETSTAAQFDEKHPAPFLAPPSPASLAQQWIFTKVG